MLVLNLLTVMKPSHMLWYEEWEDTKLNRIFSAPMASQQTDSDLSCVTQTPEESNTEHILVVLRKKTFKITRQVKSHFLTQNKREFRESPDKVICITVLL